MDARKALSHPPIVEALRATFGAAKPASFEPLGGGLSKAALFKLHVGSRAYVVRLASRSGPESDPKREFTCMQSAAERGIAPAVLYANADDGVAIMDFVEGPTLGVWLRAGGDCTQQLGVLLRHLHEGPAFPSFISIPVICEMLCGVLASHGKDTPFTRTCLSRVEEMRAAMAPHATDAPCHRDLNPGNILVQGERLWLVDWKGACQNNPFHDLATPGVFAPKAPLQRQALLRAYLGREPNEIERARFVLSRTLALTFYGIVFGAVALGRGAKEPSKVGEKPTPTGDPSKYGEALVLEAERDYASDDYASALAVLT